jgi:hypothetical protein
MVPPCSNRISRVPFYSISPVTHFHLQGYHLLWPDFPDCSTSKVTGLRANPRSLAATRGISVDFFSSGYLDVSVHQVRFVHLCIQCTITQKGWVSPFGNPRIKASLPAPRGLSQATTSFIASCRQGIHRMRLTA